MIGGLIASLFLRFVAFKMVAKQEQAVRAKEIEDNFESKYSLNAGFASCSTEPGYFSNHSV